MESSLVVQGIPIQVLDTAGIRETEDVVEKIGVTRSQTAAKQADLVLLTIDAAAGWTAEDQQLYEMVDATDRPFILVINKVDLATPETIPTLVLSRQL